MSLSYRTRRRLRHSLMAVAIILSLSLTIFIGWLVWLDRFIIYTRDGAKLDFSMSQITSDGEPAVPPNISDPIKIVVEDPDENSNQGAVEQVSINGYYVKTKDLQDDIPGLIEKLKSLPKGTAILMDMKSIKGSFYYPTTVGNTVSKDIDQEKMSQLLEFLANQDLHAIARVPAFRDWEYGLHHVSQGLPKKGANGALWIDDKSCYWLDPANDEVLGYLIRIVAELKGLGFDEVVFSEFRFPDTDKIKYDGNKQEAISYAAATLVEACSSDRFFVSFQNTDYGFPLPSGSTRLYLQNVSAAEIPLVRQQAVTKQPDIQLLFITETNDTRFDDYCVLRPLEDALIVDEVVE